MASPDSSRISAYTPTARERVAAMLEPAVLLSKAMYRTYMPTSLFYLIYLSFYSTSVPFPFFFTFLLLLLFITRPFDQFLILLGLLVDSYPVLLLCTTSISISL